MFQTSKPREASKIHSLSLSSPHLLSFSRLCLKVRSKKSFEGNSLCLKSLIMNSQAVLDKYKELPASKGKCKE